MQVYWELPSKPGRLEGFRLEYRGVSNPDEQGQETFPGHINTHTISHLGQYQHVTQDRRSRSLQNLCCDPERSLRITTDLYLPAEPAAVYEIQLVAFNGNGDSPSTRRLVSLAEEGNAAAGRSLRRTCDL